LSGLPAKFGVTRLEDGVLKSICGTNMRFARVASVLGLIVAVYVLVYDFVIAGGGLTLAQPVFEVFLRCTMVLALFAASATVFVTAQRFLHGSDLDARSAQLVLVAYAVIAVCDAVLLFVIDYPARNQVLVFVVSELVCTSVFIISPALSIPLLVAGFTAVFNVLAFEGGNLPVPFAGRALFVLMLCAMAFMRYNAAVEEAAKQEQARSISMVDELTGIMNRMFLRSDFEHHIGKPLVVMMCDLDDFKHFNDTYGHATGDRIIKSYAEALRDEFGRQQSYRYGGDEFLVITSEPLDVFEGKLARLREKTGAIDVADFERALTMSCGYCTGTPRDNQQLRNMIEIADRELYVAKRSGKNCVEHVAYDERLLEVGFGASGADSYRADDLDPLTGLVNMACFRGRAAKILGNCKARERGLAYVYFNLANFKSFNNSHGFDAGDQLLRRTAHALNVAFPGYLVSRFSEDKFSVLCLTDGLEESVSRAQQVVRDYQRGTSVELRAGIYLVDDAQVDVDQAHDRARLACDSIRGRYDVFFRYFDDELSFKHDREQFIISNLDSALARGDIRVYFQPIVRTITGAIYGFEALTRWIDPELGLISPGDFVPVLERARLTHRLDQYVLECVCRQMRALRDSGAPWINVSVNLSRLDFSALDIPRLVREVTDRYRVPRRALNIEVTESAFTDAEQRLYASVASLRSMGYSVWMDDFGSGYSSLGNLKEHKFDLIKIDMGFLRDFDPEARSNEVLASVIDMIKRMGTGSLIEGVETQEQLDFVSAVGCEFIQGYLFGKPRPLEWYVAHLDEYQVERIESRGYYDSISRVNPVSPVPFDYDGIAGKAEKGMVSSIALAVVELRGGQMSYLWANRAYEEALDAAGHVSLEDSARWVNEKRGDIKRFLKNTVRADGLRTLDFMGGGQHFLLRGKVLSAGADSAAVLVSLSGFVETGEHESVAYDTVAEYLLSTFSRVDLIDLRTREIRNVYLGRTLAGSAQEYLETTEDEAKNAVSTLVYSADRERYLEFCDLETIEQRMRCCPEPYLADVFRMRDDAGLFSWNELVVVPMQLGGQTYAISAVRRENTSCVNRLVEPDATIPRAELWDSYLDIAQVGIFWKDSRRRFLGANRFFLDYYGMDSVDQIVGKTDEDLGWHVDEAPFRADELSVLNDHEVIRDVPGHCISHCEDRAIVASKAPVIENGVAKGLVGHFIDLEDWRGDNDAPQRLAAGGRKLELAGFDTMQAQLLAFAESYGDAGRDFVFAYLAVANLEQLTGTFGEQFGAAVLGEVVHRIDVVCGSSCVLTRARDNWFALVAHVDSRQDALALIARVVAAGGGSCSIAGTSCTVELQSGAARYGETESLLALVQTAEERLLDKRHADDALAERGDGAERIARDDLIRRMKILSGYFDSVRVVSPRRLEARAFDRERDTVGKAFACYERRGGTARCDDCAALRALATGKDQVRCEHRGDALHVATYRNVVVDGEELVLVLELGLPQFALPKQEDTACQGTGDIWYRGPETGVYNRRYFDEYLLRQQATRVAKLDMDKFTLVGNRFGARAADEGLRRVAQLLASEVGEQGMVSHFGADQFVIVFLESIESKEYRHVLSRIVQGIKRLSFQPYPNLKLSASIGATERAGSVQDLLAEADWLMYQAKGSSEHVVVG
jgi:diguanylate cyclase (GGDEF)-like protein